MFVERGDDGKYKVRLEDGRTPSLFISPYYRKLLTSGQANEETREYIKQKLNSAQWLIDSIEQRRNTLTQGGPGDRRPPERVPRQGAGVDRAPEDAADRRQGGRPRDHGEPRRRRQVDSDAAGNLSAQAVLLRRHARAPTGEEVAWDTVRLKLQELIDREDKKAPYSDEDLVSELGKQGITVARRTVTKYRKAMSIPSSRQRRDWSAAPARRALRRPSRGGQPRPGEHCRGIAVLRRSS